jgi:peroxiredoxin Q/BCP
LVQLHPPLPPKTPTATPFLYQTLPGSPWFCTSIPKTIPPAAPKQACGFRDSYQQYLSKGIAVLGVSLDDEASHKAFTDKYSLPFPLLADTDGSITKAYDVEGERNGVRYAQRVTYLLAPDGKISQVYGAGTVNTDTHASDVLVALGA